jgi:hypothetical protein
MDGEDRVLARLGNPEPYLLRYTDMSLASSPWSVTRLATPSTTTDSSAGSALTTHLEFTARLRALRERPPVLKCKAPLVQTPQTAPGVVTRLAGSSPARSCGPALGAGPPSSRGAGHYRHQRVRSRSPACWGEWRWARHRLVVRCSIPTCLPVAANADTWTLPDLGHSAGRRERPVTSPQQIGALLR